MKTKLLILMILGVISVNAQTTHQLNWQIGSNGPEMDLTIEIGDTVEWTWTDALPHTVQNVVGSSVETFTSGVLTGLGSTYSYTFTVEGVNDYFCGVHGVASMSGTITVVTSLSVEDQVFSNFKILPNPVAEDLYVDLPSNIREGQVTVYNLLGKKVIEADFKNSDDVTINISGLSKGLYIISVVSENTIQTKRFIKK